MKEKDVGKDIQIRWGLVGLGRLANDWIAPAIRTSHSGRLVACAGHLIERTREFATTHGVERVYDSYEDLVKDPDVDAIYVAAPNHLHHSVAMAAAHAGKHVLCQKPMGLTVEEAEEMIDACATAGVTLRIGLQLRFQKVLQAAADQVQKGYIGSVREVSAQRYGPVRESKGGGWRSNLSTAGAGALADLGVHVVDFVQWILNEQIVRVFAFSYPNRSSGRPEETATVFLEFVSGCQATIRCSREMPIGANDLQIYGKGGMLITGPLRWANTHHLTLRTPNESKVQEYPADNLYLREIEAFAETLAGESTPIATGEDGLRLVRVTGALIRSLETGCAISMES